MSPTDVTAWATVALVIVAGLAFIANVVIAAFTLQAVRATCRSAQATEQAAAATQRSAEATERSADATRDEANATREEAAATREEAAIARQTLESSWRPLVVDVPFGYAVRRVTQPPYSDVGEADAAEVTAVKRGDGTARVVVPFRNIGSGPALISKAVLSIGQLHAEATSFSSSVVAAREVVRVYFELAPAGAILINLISQIDAGKAFTVAVFYGDQGGTGHWRSRAVVHRPAGASSYEVLNVELYEGDATTPFATSGQGAP